MTKGGLYPTEPYKGYFITPAPDMDPVYNDYKVYIKRGSDIIDVVSSFTWRATVESARHKIDLLPTNFPPTPVKPTGPKSKKPYTETQKLHLADLAGLKPHNMTVEEEIKEEYESKPYIATEARRMSERRLGEPELYLNERIFEQDYKPKGWHLLVIGPTATWRQEWHEWEAIRDIVQNALDEGEAYTFGFDGDGLWIADSGRGINISDFLLGPAKLKPDYARGKFGEGMKVSALVLTRLGYRVHVRTADKDLWICYYQQEVGTGKTADTLAALWKESIAHFGTRFNIIGYRGSSFKELFAVNIPLDMVKQSTPSHLSSPIKRFNKIYRTDQDYLPMIYCRDIFLQKITSKYSYNLWGFDLSPDRHGPKSDSDVDTDIGRTWAYVKDQSMLEDLFRGMILDDKTMSYEKNHVAFSRWYMGSPAGDETQLSYMDEMERNKSIWQAAFKSVAGQKTVVRTESKYDPMVTHLGYKSVLLPWNVENALKEILPTDISVVKESMDELRGTKIIPDESLTYSQLLNLKLARMISGNVLYSSIKVHAAIIPNAGSEGGLTEGFYDTILREIYLQPTVLENGGSTVDVTIHEAAHALNNSSDLTPGHAKAMTNIASMVFGMVSKGYFDKILKDPNFVW